MVHHFEEQRASRGTLTISKLNCQQRRFSRDARVAYNNNIFCRIRLRGICLGSCNQQCSIICLPKGILENVWLGSALLLTGLSP
jgi:hypothetical protein